MCSGDSGDCATNQACVGVERTATELCRQKQTPQIYIFVKRLQVPFSAPLVLAVKKYSPSIKHISVQK